MLSNPLILPHADGNISLVKINQDSYASEYYYRSSTRAVTVKIRHSTIPAKGGKPSLDRHNVEVAETVFATVDAEEIFRRAYIVIEQKSSDGDVKLVDALADWLIATANANAISLLGWES